MEIFMSWGYLWVLTMASAHFFERGGRLQHVVCCGQKEGRACPMDTKKQIVKGRVFFIVKRRRRSAHVAYLLILFYFCEIIWAIMWEYQCMWELWVAVAIYKKRDVRAWTIFVVILCATPHFYQQNLRVKLRGGLSSASRSSFINFCTWLLSYWP